MKWVGPEPPLIKDQLILIKEVIPLEKLGIYVLKGQSDLFRKLWADPLKGLGIACKFTVYH